ncbi:D-alanyl-D-alanine carboxypeptidase/D-alanyl-D-alanine-endopeptidase [Arthrobacter sp. NPDC090010]|uniref:D-alanyl-D-alanine carboxypeptidase/D-alanyl-D-alanine endopeptidase n=1 Tax=Arthrobacter sp. NPDC090010 TaxID=3363942 RepID=UPI00382432EB
MGRTARILSSVLLVLALAALAVPLGIHWSEDGLAEAPQPAVTTPAWQLPPTPEPATDGALTTAAPTPSSARLTELLGKSLVPDGGGDFSAQVTDALTGSVLYGSKADEPRAPASNMKLLTAAAALQVLGPDARFSTEVRRTGAGSLSLRGGGDVLLGAGESKPSEVMGHAGLATLAGQTVAALKAGGAKGKLTVAADARLFSGPAVNPTIEPDDVSAGETAPVAPLALNSGRFDASVETGPRPQDQPAEVLKAFVAALNAAASKAGAPLSFAAGGSAGDGPVLSSVASATVAGQVSWMLQNSDNFLTAVMGRMVAVKEGRAGGYADAIVAVRNELEKLGMDTKGMVIADLSGLAPANRVSAAQFSWLVRLMATGDNASLRAALAGFPVAGVSGTLGSRYASAESKAGAGLVRAKTGTLNTVLSLSGYVVDADGRLLIFSFIGNGLTAGAAGNKAALDDSASILAGCGCR